MPFQQIMNGIGAVARYMLLIGMSLVSLHACRLTSAISDAEQPSDIRDPKAFQNEPGALAMYRNTINSFATGIGARGTSLVRSIGMFTDELHGVAIQPSGSTNDNVDLRFFPDPQAVPDPAGFSFLHQIRASSREARGNIRQYGPNLPTELLSHLYALEGMAEVFLAELFCSGIPLSTLDFGKDFTLSPGLSTDEVYDHAIILLDSAISLAGDSLRFRYLAQLGKARAYLGKGDLEAAGQAIQTVPADYRYTLFYTISQPKFTPDQTISRIEQSDREGTNGQPFLSSGDPRILLPGIMNQTAPLVFATGVETYLIQAEVALHKNDSTWLTKLNQLRTTCIINEPCPTPAPAGIGGIMGLPPLQDPAAGKLTQTDSLDARIDMVFAERAFWFYLTGRRQGDLRRLVRHYQWPQIRTYPSGLWGDAGVVQYGDAVVIPTPESERRTNYLYKGCDNFDA